MKSLNINVVLIVMIGLASGVLLLPESMLSFNETAVEVIDESSSNQEFRTAEVRPAPAMPEPVVDGAANAASQELTLNVTGLKEKPSSVYVAVFESEAGFPRSESSNRTKVVSTTEGQVRLALDLPRDIPVAIAVFQDIDGDGKLSKNSIGIPTEPYGFSNNARGILGPPSFSDAALRVSAAGEATEPVEIRVR